MAFTPNSDIAGLMEGEAPLRRQAPGQVLNLTATPDFRYKHHPMRWECVRGRWLPQLAKLKLEPGVNGIAHDLGEAQARENARQIGWQILDQDHLFVVACKVAKEFQMEFMTMIGILII